MSQYFPPYRNSGNNIKVELDLSNYATKSDLRSISRVEVKSFALRRNLASLKSEVHKLDIDKLVPVPVDLSKLSDVVKNEYDKLVTKLNNIDTTNFVLKTKYENDRSDFEDKISKLDKKNS